MVLGFRETDRIRGLGTYALGPPFEIIILLPGMKVTVQEVDKMYVTFRDITKIRV